MLQECRNCGAQIEYSAESQSLVCPYCDSVNVIQKQEDALPVDAEFIIPLALTPDALERNVYGYLAQGEDMPDDMLESVVFLRRECFYVPSYTFSVGYDVNWTASFGYTTAAYSDRVAIDWRPVSGRDGGTFEVATYAGTELSASSLNPVEIVPFTIRRGERTRFNPAFLQGTRAETFAVSEQLAYTSLHDEIARNITHNVQRHAQGNYQRDWNWNLAGITPFTGTLYVPVACAVFDYKGQNYHYWSDGLTGESIKADRLPTDDTKMKRVHLGWIPMLGAFAGMAAAALYTRSSAAAPDALLKIAIGMAGPILALCYAIVRRYSIFGYSKRLRNSILAQMQASSASSADLDDKGKRALAKAMQRPVKSLFARTELDKKMIPGVAGIAFLAALLPSFFVGNPPSESTAAAAQAPTPRVAQTIQTRPAQPKAPPVAAQASAPSQDGINYCEMRVFLADLSKSERLFIQQTLISSELDINTTNVQFSVREAADSPGTPKFKCVGKVTVTSKSTNAPVLSYDIVYSTYMAEGSSGIDQKTIARANIQSPDPAVVAQQQEQARQEAERRRAQAAARQQAEAQKAREEQARREAERRRLAAQQEEQARQAALARQQADVQRAREENARREAERQKQQEKNVASRVWRSIKESTRKP